MPSGFVALLRKCLCLPTEKDPWSRGQGEEDGALPAHIKITEVSKGQIELKLIYQANSQLKSQKYEVEIFLFFAAELEAVNTSLYSSLWQVIRLHTPKAALATLAAHPMLRAASERLQELQAEAYHDCREDLSRQAVQLIRLYACTFRTACRKSTSKITHLVEDVEATGNPYGAERQAAVAICGLVGDACAAIRALQEVCKTCLAADMPRRLQQVWLLVDEFMLNEAARALLKLMWHLDKLQHGMALSQADVQIADLSADGCKAQACKDRLAPEDLGSQASLVLVVEEGQILQTNLQHVSSVARDGDISFGRAALQQARSLVFKAVALLERESHTKGYTESIIDTNDEHGHEAYTNRVKVLKRHARAAVSLMPQVQRPSNLLADLVGMTIAGLAMGFALATLFFAFTKTRYFGVFYIAIYVLGYMIKDRMKEWGKRYLQPCAEWFGYRFPDRILKVVDQRKEVVGRCEETIKVKDDTDIAPRVLAMRYTGSTPPPEQHGDNGKPERVMVYSKRMQVHWSKLSPGLQRVRGLSDIMRVDFNPFCRHDLALVLRMQSASEVHFQLRQHRGQASVVEVHCARVYHMNLVVSVLARNQDSLQLQKARVVLDQDGIKRLEAAGTDLLSRPRTRHGLARLTMQFSGLRANHKSAVATMCRPFQPRVSANRRMVVVDGEGDKITTTPGPHCHDWKRTAPERDSANIGSAALSVCQAV